MEGRLVGEGAQSFKPELGFLGNLVTATDDVQCLTPQGLNAPRNVRVLVSHEVAPCLRELVGENNVSEVGQAPTQGGSLEATAGQTIQEAAVLPGELPPMTTPQTGQGTAAVSGPKKRGRPPGSGKSRETNNKKKKDKEPPVDEAVLQEAASRMWKDEWVAQLIEQRALMQPLFDSPKQGVDLWSKVATEVLANCPDFNKNAEACRKRFAKELKDYQGDKAQNAKSGHDRGDRSKHYELMDEHFASKATVHCVAHADSETVDDPSGSGEQPNSSGASSLAEKPKRSASKRDGVASELSATFANTSEAFMGEYTRIEARKSDQIKELTDLLRVLVDKL